MATLLTLAWSLSLTLILALAWTLSLALSLSHTAIAAPTFPKPLGLVSDYAGKLSPSVKNRIETTLNDFRTRSGGIEIAVVTIPLEQLDGLPIEDYALQLGREWGIGGGSDKAGLLLVVAIGPQDESGNYRGATRLEVSRHLEGDIPDALAGQIISRMRGDLRAGRFDDAISTAVDSVVSIISQRRGISGGQAQPPPPSRRGRGSSGFGAIVWVLVLLAIVGTIIALALRGSSRGPLGRDRWSSHGRRRGHDSDWMIWPIFFGGGGSGGFGGSGGSSGSSDSGGFSDFGGGDSGGFSGGGDFGGGGAGDSW